MNSLFITAFFIIGKTWKQLKQSIDRIKQYTTLCIFTQWNIIQSQNEFSPLGQHGWILRALCLVK